MMGLCWGLGLMAMLLLSAPLRASALELLVLGDSISAGYGLAGSNGWVQLLEQRLQQRQH